MSGESADKLVALEDARARLELSLSGDENWRALRESEARADDWSADRQARDARLMRALDENPLYHAWRHIIESIDKLRDAERTAAAPAPEPAFAEAPAMASPAEASATGDLGSELPDDIRAILRRDTAELSLPPASAPPVNLASDAEIESVSEEVDDADVTASGEGADEDADDSVRIVAPKADAPEEDAGPDAGDNLALPGSDVSSADTGVDPRPVDAPFDLDALKSRIDRLDAQLRSLDAPGKADERGERPAGESDEAESGDGDVHAVIAPALMAATEAAEVVPPAALAPSAPEAAPADPEPAAPARSLREAEATVTFVTQEPDDDLAETDSDDDGATELYARDADADDERQPNEDTGGRSPLPLAAREAFVPSRHLEEAEVTIITPEKIIPPDQPSKLPPGPISRFLRALSGE